MKYAAKKTWPHKSQSWDHQGESETLEAFASEFAAVEQLAVDTELVVMEREGASPAIRFFRVSSASPCVVVPAEPRTEGEVSGVAETAAEAEAAKPDAGEAAAPVGVPNLSPAISMLLYMAKVALIATATIAALAVLMSYFKRWVG